MFANFSFLIERGGHQTATVDGRSGHLIVIIKRDVHLIAKLRETNSPLTEEVVMIP